ncbi:MAG: hypothetical protein QOH93_1028 [Chloroflexia bacterium]|jgi:hypothetical protein|nr:hypothetical protein [Chloroflexia bacterium]
MDVSTYRKKYDEYRERVKQQHERRSAHLEAARATGVGLDAFAIADTAGDEDPAADAIAVIRNRDEDAENRAVTLHSISSEIAKREDLIDMVLGLLRDTTEPMVLRLEALRILQALNFSSALFNTKRPEYIAALRELVNAEELELRERVLELLAQENDEYVQRRLVEGLNDPSKALLPPEKAIPLLGYDIHASHFPLLREMVMKPPSAAAKREALRLLAADPASKEMLASILTNKKESRETRRISALALRALSPEAFDAHARQIVFDDDENQSLLATSINALTHSNVQQTATQSRELDKRIEQLSEQTHSKDVKRAAQIYMHKQSQQPE